MRFTIVRLMLSCLIAAWVSGCAHEIDSKCSEGWRMVDGKCRCPAGMHDDGGTCFEDPPEESGWPEDGGASEDFAQDADDETQTSVTAPGSDSKGDRSPAPPRDQPPVTGSRDAATPTMGPVPTTPPAPPGNPGIATPPASVPGATPPAQTPTPPPAASPTTTTPPPSPPPAGAECQHDHQCTGRYLPFCEKGKCVACRQPRDCGGRACINHTCTAEACSGPQCAAPVCGDGVFAESEQCEFGFGGGGAHTWNESNCTSDCRLRYWQRCSTSNQCPTGSTCVPRLGFCLPRTCEAGASEAECAAMRNLVPSLPSCPSVPTGETLLWTEGCFISCSAGKCPSGLQCIGGGEGAFCMP
jgi:hypothetical protein